MSGWKLKRTTILFSLSHHQILSSDGELWLIKHRLIIMVRIWCYNQGSGVTELLIMRDPYYGRMCFKSVKTVGASTFLAKEDPQLTMQSSSGFILNIIMIIISNISQRPSLTQRLFSSPSEVYNMKLHNGRVESRRIRLM